MYRVGIDLGGTNIKVGLVDEGQNIVQEAYAPTNSKRPAEQVIADMAVLVEKVIEQHAGWEEILGIGAGSAGMIDAKNGRIPYSNNLGWEDVEFAKLLKEYLHRDCRVCISNDANCAALGEAKAGAAKGVDNVVLLTLGTGIGGGVIIDGKIFEGAYAGGAELGHTSLICGGEPCTCGRKGCVEAYVSATALIRDARRAAKKYPASLLNTLAAENGGEMNGKIPFDAVLQQDEAAVGVVDRYIGYLTETIANFINLFRPDVVLLSGGLCNQGERLTKPINEKLPGLCFGGAHSVVAPVRCASLGSRAGIIGAANLIE